MLLPMDEYPYHQITDTFAGGGRAAIRSGTTATTCASATPPAACASRRTCGSTRTTTCSTASSASATRACSTTCGCRGVCGRTWTTSAPGRCGSSSSSPCGRCGWSSRTTSTDIALDVPVPQHDRAVHGPDRDHADRRSAAERTGDLRGDRRGARAGCGWAAHRYELAPSTVVVLPQPLVGLPGRSGRPAPVRRAERARRGGCRASGSGCCSTCREPRRLLLRGPQAPGGLGQGGDPARRRRRADRRAWSTTSSSTRAAAGCSEGTFRARRRRRARAHATRWRTSVGSTARGAATSAGSTTGSGRASTAATTTSRARCGTSATPPRSSTRAARSFEFDHDWAESFTRLRSGGETGLAHYECVVIAPKPGSDR